MNTNDLQVFNFLEDNKYRECIFRESYLSTNTSMQKRDILFLSSILKRQYHLIKDLYTLHDIYPDIIDKDLMCSIDSIFRVLDDIKLSENMRSNVNNQKY